MIDLSKYDNKKYDDKHYNCLHFAVDFWRDLTGKDIDIYVDNLMCGRETRQIKPDELRKFKLLDKPKSPSVAVMRQSEPHAGVYVDGLIYNLTENGVSAQPPHILSLKYGRIKYYDI